MQQETPQGLWLHALARGLRPGSPSPPGLGRTEGLLEKGRQLGSGRRGVITFRGTLSPALVYHDITRGRCTWGILSEGGGATILG